MSNFSSNCYGFVYAWLKNSEEEFFKDIDDLKLRKAEIKGKIDERIIDTSDAIKEVFSLNDFSQELEKNFSNSKNLNFKSSKQLKREPETSVERKEVSMSHL